MTVSQPNPLDARAYSAAAMAATGLVLWGLQTFALKNQPVPAAVSAEIYTLLPAAAGFVASHLTRKHTTTELDSLKSRFIQAAKSGSVSIIPTQMASTTQTAPAMPLPHSSDTQEGASGPAASAPDTPSP